MDKTAKLPVVLKALRDLLQAVERCEDNDFSEELRKHLADAATAASGISVKFRAVLIPGPT